MKNIEVIAPFHGQTAPVCHARSVEMQPFCFFAAIAALAIAGLALRLWNIDFGLPECYHPDENIKVCVINCSLSRGSLDDIQHPLTHPGFMVSAAAGFSRLAIGMGYPADRADIILYGRILAALFGAATILAVAALGATACNRRCGLLAAAIVTFSPAHVVHSRYLKEDVFLALFVALALVGAAWWLGEGARRRRGVLICAAAAGLAAACKFVGLMMIPMMLAFFSLGGRSSRRERFLFLLVAVAAFALGASMFLANIDLGWREFVYAVKRGSLEEWNDVAMPFYRWPDLGLYFLFHGINWGLGWPLAVIAAWGIACAVRRRGSRPCMWIIALMALAWYAMAELTTLKPNPDSERYIVPCIPPLAVLAAGVVMGARASYWRVLGWCFVAVMAVQSLALSHSIRDDTRKMAARWIRQIEPKPCAIACVGRIDAYRFDRQPLKGYRIAVVTQEKPKLRIRLSGADKNEVLVISHFVTDRFERFRGHNRKIKRDLERLRAMFPYAVIFKKPWYARMGFHNPVIEVRFKHPVQDP